jgi:hypothetical protein
VPIGAIKIIRKNGVRFRGGTRTADDIGCHEDLALRDAFQAAEFLVIGCRQLALFVAQLKVGVSVITAHTPPDKIQTRVIAVHFCNI